MYPDDCKYTNEHEWIREEDGLYAVGITSFAAEQLGDVTYVELPEVGTEVNKGEAVAMVESVKAASDVYAPVTGKVVEVNESLENQPELINQDAYELGWFFKMDEVRASELKGLLDAKGYAAFVEEQQG